MKCIICFDNTQKHGLTCHNKNKQQKHFTCEDCLPNYVSSLCQDVGKLKDVDFTICCPDVECKKQRNTWSFDEIVACLSKQGAEGQKVVAQLMGTFAKAARNTKPEEETRYLKFEPSDVHVRATLANALCLKCPSSRCGKILDQNPDGCAAIRCLHCSQHFCWMCLQACRGDAHDHVRNCPSNPRKGRDYFFQTVSERLQVQKPLRIVQIRAEFTKAFGPEWQHNREVRCSLVDAKQLLEDTHVSLEDIVGDIPMPPPSALAAAGLIHNSIISTVNWFTIGFVIALGIAWLTPMVSFISFTSQGSDSSSASGLDLVNLSVTCAVYGFCYWQLVRVIPWTCRTYKLPSAISSNSFITALGVAVGCHFLYNHHQTLSNSCLFVVFTLCPVMAQIIGNACMGIINVMGHIWGRVVISVDFVCRVVVPFALHVIYSAKIVFTLLLTYGYILVATLVTYLWIVLKLVAIYALQLCFVLLSWVLFTAVPATFKLLWKLAF